MSIKFNLFILFLVLSLTGGSLSWAQLDTLPSVEKTITGTLAPIDEIDFKDAELKSIVEFIGTRAGLNIVGAEKLQGKTSIFLKNVDPFEALRIVLEANNFAYTQAGNDVEILTVDEYQNMYARSFGENLRTKVIKLSYSQASVVIDILNQLKSARGKITINSDNSLTVIDEPALVESMVTLVQEIDVPLKSQTFELTNARASEIELSIQEMLTKNLGKTDIDEATNRITVTDTAANLKKIEEFIDTLDRIKKEVLMETKVYQIVLNDEHESGVDWEAIVSDYKHFSYQGTSATDPSMKKIMSLGTVTEEDLNVLLEALDTVGSIKTILNTRLVGADNKKSELNVKTIQASTLGNQPAAGVDAPIKFFITPVKGDDEYFNLRVFPDEQSLKIDWPPVEASAPSSAVDIKVKEGDTLVIGGLFKDVAVESLKKFPLLGDIPLLGMAFRNQREILKNSEVIIFITPRVIIKDQ